LKYRAEIDGLRALAVVPVILFHAGFELFSGGFVGVDVFFVISGYLITTILIEDIENKRFSIVNFYERRARRILPALFFVVLVCIPFAWMWMLPSQMKDFSQSLVAVSLFASNILFWRESGYFDAAAAEKPLLHTWSLAVEEQYYVLFPIFLILAWRFGKNRVFWMIVVMAALSLILSEWGWRKQPTANFYLAPTRAWELFAGSIAAFIVQKQGVKRSDFLALLGMVAIVFSIFAYDESTPFPSVYALVPVLGVVLLVLFADKETLAAKLLSTKAFVGIGLISYSAYLWHQPLFAFARIKSVSEPTILLMVSLVLCSFAFAFASWKYIEKPFRVKGVQGRKTIFISSLLGLFVFFTLGLLGHKNVILPYSKLVITELLGNIDESEYGGEGYEKIDLVEKPTTLIVGDSHAKQYLKAARELNPNVSLITESACLSLPNLINEYKGQSTTRHECIKLHERYLDYLVRNTSVERLIFSHRWGKRLYDLKNRSLLGRAEDSEVVFERLRQDLVKYFNQLSNTDIKIIIIGNVPSAYVASPYMKDGYVKCIYKYGASNCPKTYDRGLREGKRINDLLMEIANMHDNILFLDPAEKLCSEYECFVVKGDQLFYSDHAHLTTLGAREVLRDIID
jgi:peptidoglycan/LPS O-acetylase OafA/YrhL